MPTFTDQLGRTLFLPGTPRRIISLVPSQTELLHTLGLDEAVVGITKFCVHPQSWFRHKPRVGGTKAVDPARIDALQPDLIIANKEENEKAQVEALAGRYPVWISDVKTLPDALDMIRGIGKLTGTALRAAPLAETIAARFRQLSLPADPIPAAYIIWKDPFERPAFRTRRIDANASARHIPMDSARALVMVAGGDTFINDMLRYAGYSNLFGHRDRYPTISLSDLSGPKNLHILLSSEPYPFRDRHVAELQEVLPDAVVRLVDGEYFSWYGSRLLETPAYFQTGKNPIFGP